jgi:hypothetical protein
MIATRGVFVEIIYSGNKLRATGVAVEIPAGMAEFGLRFEREMIGPRPRFSALRTKPVSASERIFPGAARKRSLDKS